MNYYQHSRPEVVDLIGEKLKGARVLDVGCAAGAMGELMKTRGAAWVEGVEPMLEAAKLARDKLDRVFHDKLEAAYSVTQGPLFDVITAADVLEHMEDPWGACRSIHARLKPDGVFVASVPNVRHESVLLPLLISGEFKYQEAGILDKTHLRFFTKSSMLEMFQETGFEVEVMQRVTSEASPYSLLLRRAVMTAGGDVAKLAEESTTIQYLFRMRKI